MPELRIVKLVVGVYAVLDDGEHLHEQIIAPLEVPGSKLEEFIDGGLERALEDLSLEILG